MSEPGLAGFFYNKQLLRKMKGLFVALCLFFAVGVFAQPIVYTVANTHSHNDYEQRVPFWTAYNERFGSIEADIWLRKGPLLIGHDTNEIKAGRTLEEYYLRPLLSCVQKNKGYPYADSSRQLQMLIDIKTDSIGTLDTLIGLLSKYPALIGNPSIKWVITGNRPDASRWVAYPGYIWFDGILNRGYSQDALSRIVMLSDDFKSYSHWNGKGLVPEKEWKVLQGVVKKAHDLNKHVRFWDAPDFINAWLQFTRLQVDYINTDHIEALSNYLK
jgi:alkaline phosphatase